MAVYFFDSSGLAAAVEVGVVCEKLDASAPILVSSDTALNEAAREEEIIVEDPNSLAIDSNENE